MRTLRWFLAAASRAARSVPLQVVLAGRWFVLRDMPTWFVRQIARMPDGDADTNSCRDAARRELLLRQLRRRWQ